MGGARGLSCPRFVHCREETPLKHTTRKRARLGAKAIGWESKCSPCTSAPWMAAASAWTSGPRRRWPECGRNSRRHSGPYQISYENLDTYVGKLIAEQLKNVVTYLCGARVKVADAMHGERRITPSNTRVHSSGVRSSGRHHSNPPSIWWDTRTHPSDSSPAPSSSAAGGEEAQIRRAALCNGPSLRAAPGAFTDMHEEPFRKRPQPRQGGLRESCRGRWPCRAGASAASAAALSRREGGSPNRHRVPVNGKCTAWSA